MASMPRQDSDVNGWSGLHNIETSLLLKNG
jgi:hypothetical protein